MAVQAVSKAGVGEVVFHARWWRPRKVARVEFRPEGRQIAHPVPMEAVPGLLGAESLEEAMALIRAADRT